MKLRNFFILLFSLLLSLNSNSQCNTNTTICTPGVAGPFNLQPASTNPSSCLDYWNGQGSANYAYIILYITQGGDLNLLVDGNSVNGFLDVSIFDITGSSDPCNDLSISTELSCNYASGSDGCAQFGTTFPCGSDAPAPTVQAGDVIMILVEDWSDTQTSFTIELDGGAGSAQTGPPDATITPVGPFCENDNSVQLQAVDMGGNWTGNGVSNTGVFDPVTAGVGTHTIDYTIGSAPCDSQGQTTIVVNEVFNVTVNDDICDGGTYTFPDGTSQTINSNISQISNLVTTNGCDSIITTNLTTIPSPSTSENFDICSGSNYTFPDGTSQTNITNPLSYTSNLVTANGCDSTVITNLTISSVINTTVNDDICEGDTYTFPDGTSQTINADMSQQSNLISTNGCDSIVTTNLTVNPTYNINESFTICNDSDYTFPDGTTQTNIITPVSYTSNLVTANGCDSIIVTDILIYPVYNDVENVDVCEGDIYIFPDGTSQTNITSNTTYTSNLVTTNGCDSTITTNINTILEYTTTVNTSVCDGDNYTFSDGTTQTINGQVSYTSTLISNGGCDSLVTEIIDIYPTYDQTQTIDQCPGLDYTFPDGTLQTDINSNVSYTSNLTTLNGCDSTITTNVNIYDIPPFDISISPNGCPDLEVEITNNTNGADCVWELDGPLSEGTYTSCDLYGIFTHPGQYDLTLTMLSSDGCPMDTIMNSTFEVYPEPNANFTWSPFEGTLIDNNITFTNQSIGGNNYYWNFGDGETSNNFQDSHTYQDSGSYVVELIIENTYGCSDTATGLVLINEQFSIFVPNTFTPYGDSHNNTFVPILKAHDPQNYELLIFNRWGEVIFESHDALVGWNGMYGGKIVKDGTYIWKINVKTWDGKDKEYNGHVNLLR